MTRKDYIALAAALKREKPGTNWDPNKRVQWNLDVQAVAFVLRGDNPRFDQNRFFAACGVVE